MGLCIMPDTEIQKRLSQPLFEARKTQVFLRVVRPRPQSRTAAGAIGLTYSEERHLAATRRWEGVQRALAPALLLLALGLLFAAGWAQC